MSEATQSQTQAQSILNFTDNSVTIHKHYISIKEKLPISTLAHRLLYGLLMDLLESLKEIQNITMEISINDIIQRLKDSLQQYNYMLYLDIHLVKFEETDETYLRQCYQFIRQVKNAQLDAHNYQVAFADGAPAKPGIYLVDIVFLLALFQPISIEVSDRNIASAPRIFVKLGEQAIKNELFTCYNFELPEALALRSRREARNLKAKETMYALLVKIIQFVSQFYGQQGVSSLFLADAVTNFALYVYHTNLTDVSGGDERRKEILQQVQKALDPSYLPYPYDSLLRKMRAREQVTFSAEKNWVHVPPYDIWSKADLLKNITYFPNGIRLMEILPQLDKSLETEYQGSDIQIRDSNSMESLFSYMLDQLEYMVSLERDDHTQTSVPDSSMAGTLPVSLTSRYPPNTITNAGNNMGANTMMTQQSVANAGRTQTVTQGAGMRPEDRPSYKLIIKPLLESRELAQCTVQQPSGPELYIFSRVPALSYTRKVIEESADQQRDKRQYRRPVFKKLASNGLREFMFKKRGDIFGASSTDLDKIQGHLRQLLNIDETMQQTKTRFSQSRQAKEWMNTHITEEWYLKSKEDRNAQ